MAESYPDDLLYNAEHDWARIEGDEAVLGITWHAVDALGELVHYEPPTVGQTIAKAASLTASGGTVWLTNGIYNATTQPAPIAIPNGVALRALTPGLAAIGQGIALQGSASVVGIVLRRLNFGDIGWIEASSGMVAIDGVRVVGSAQAPSGFPAAIALSGTVQATMTPGGIADYADQLTQTLPAPLRVCFLVSSASEANELAIRLARAATGRRDLLVLDAAYHGNTTTLIDASPYKHAGPGGLGAPDWVHVAPLAEQA